jgi:hypothetical protein
MSDSVRCRAGGRGCGNGRYTKVCLREKLASFSSHWDPTIVGELNGQHVKLHVLLFEPVTTSNTGNVVSERTVAQPARM